MSEVPRRTTQRICPVQCAVDGGDARSWSQIACHPIAADNGKNKCWLDGIIVTGLGKLTHNKQYFSEICR